MGFDLKRDAEGLKGALLDLFEEALAMQRLQPKLATANSEDRVRLLSALPKRPLSPGYYKLSEYLLWLEERMQIGLNGSVAMLAYEADGLCVLRRARQEFERMHPPCGRCGELQDNRFSLKCWACGLEFAKAS